MYGRPKLGFIKYLLITLIVAVLLLMLIGAANADTITLETRPDGSPGVTVDTAVIPSSGTLPLEVDVYLVFKNYFMSESAQDVPYPLLFGYEGDTITPQEWQALFTAKMEALTGARIGRKLVFPTIGNSFVAGSFCKNGLPQSDPRLANGFGEFIFALPASESEGQPSITQINYKLNLVGQLQASQPDAYIGNMPILAYDPDKVAVSNVVVIAREE